MIILIAVPTADFIEPEVFQAIYDMDRAGHQCIFRCVRGYGCAESRNNIINEGKKLGADYILMIDSDTIPPTDTLVRMLENPVDVCLGTYAYKPGGVNGHSVVIFKQYDINGDEYYNYDAESMYQDDEIEELKSIGAKKIQVHGGGFGCALIKTDCVDKFVEQPPFRWITYPDGGTLSEDLYFCEQCKHAGIPVHADVRIRCGHIMKHIK